MTKRRASGLPGAPLPLQWMDPMSWRLPSGKALAEFALQSGFLAPLLMSGPMGDGRVKRKKKVEEAPDLPGRFRRSTASVTRQG
ncbi:MAG: hypothetical protein ABIR70_17420 [Bryobacteraceae bacterium]